MIPIQNIFFLDENLRPFKEAVQSAVQFLPIRGFECAWMSRNDQPEDIDQCLWTGQSCSTIGIPRCFMCKNIVF